MTLHSHEHSRTSWTELPTAIRDYLVAHRAQDAATAITTFTDDAEVIDEGHTYRGRQEIRAWLDRAGSEYTYTTDFTGATTSGPADVDVTQHLAGDFPGGSVDLHYRFSMSGALIGRLTIEQ